MPLAPYFDFVAGNRRFLGFGFLAAFFSSFGQTYFIGVFGPDIQLEFGLSHTRWGFIYMLGTLTSAALLPFTGRFIDHLNLRHFAIWVCAASIFACLFISLSSGSLMLVAAIFFLRHCGQGLMSHMSMTSMARYFHSNRGRAIAIGSLGYAAGEACLPLIAVLLIALLGWRWTYALAGAVMLLAFLPSSGWLLQGQVQRHRRYLDAEAATPDQTAVPGRRSWTRRQMLRDPRFYLLIPGVVCPSMISTALFFHHLNLADAKHWSHAWMTASYSAYAAVVVVTTLLAGPLIDRLGAGAVVRAMLLPLVLAVLVVANVQAPWTVWPYMLCLGIAAGLTHTGVSAIWAELYGTTWLGSIRSLAAALSVFSSALGPVIIGAIVDRGIAVGDAFMYFVPYALVCMALINIALSLRSRGEIQAL